jgi:type IV secretory pathway VirB4 component
MSKEKKTKNSVKKGKKDPKLSTQRYLKIAEIRDDVVVLKNGGLRAVLKTSSINLNLKSEEEQNAVIYSYQNFLNTLEFPIQVTVRSKKLDLDTYIEKLKKIGVGQSNPLLQKQTFEYIEYISRLVEYADIMEKEFYVVVPQDPFGEEKKSFLRTFKEYILPQDNVAKITKRHRQFEELKKRLTQRMNIVKAGLEGCNLRVQPLNTQELIELYYETYNPMTSRNQKFAPEAELALEGDEQNMMSVRTAPTPDSKVE